MSQILFGFSLAPGVFQELNLPSRFIIYASEVAKF